MTCCHSSLFPPSYSGYIFFVNENWEHSLTFSLEEMAVLTAMSALSRLADRQNVFLTRPECSKVAKIWFFKVFYPYPGRIIRYTDASKLGWHDVIMMKLKNETYRQTGMNCHAHKKYSESVLRELEELELNVGWDVDIKFGCCCEEGDLNSPLKSAAVCYFKWIYDQLHLQGCTSFASHFLIIIS